MLDDLFSIIKNLVLQNGNIQCFDSVKSRVLLPKDQPMHMLKSEESMVHQLLVFCLQQELVLLEYILYGCNYISRFHLIINHKRSH